MSDRINKIKKWLLIFVGGYGLLYFSFGIMVGLTSGDTIKHSQEMLNDFKKTASFVDSFKASKFRLPTQIEIESEFGEHYTVSISPFQDVDRPAFLLAKPSDSYILYFWRGEWAEYFAGWNQQTTLTFDKSNYFPLNILNFK